ncbi:MAG TPA: hypothetical protein VGJ45_25375 [Pseudonocardiaceae bacterium]|jgi:hypothetical protein
MPELGDLLSRHVVDNRRRLITGCGWILLAAAGVAVLVLEIDFGASGTSFGKLGGLALCAIAGGALAGVPQLVRALRNGLHDVIELHENGVARTGRCWTWEQISSIRPPTTVSRQWVGAAFRHSSVRFDDGTYLRVDRLTGDGATLIATLAANRPDAVVPPEQPTLWQRIVVWPLAVLAIACVAGVIYQITYINAHDNVQVEIAPGTWTEESMSDSLGTALAIGMLAGFIGAVLATTGFVTVYRNLRRWQRGGRA